MANYFSVVRWIWVHNYETPKLDDRPLIIDIVLDMNHSFNNRLKLLWCWKKRVLILRSAGAFLKSHDPNSGIEQLRYILLQLGSLRVMWLPFESMWKKVVKSSITHLMAALLSDGGSSTNCRHKLRTICIRTQWKVSPGFFWKWWNV